jgi:hypothetical protein
MLVRFLSYAASVIGARRYKPLLISCLALIFSVTGITIVATALSSGSHDAASHVTQGTTDKTGKNPQTASQLGGLEKKAPKDTAQQASPQTSTQQNSTSGTNQSSGSDSKAVPLDMTVNTTTISLNQASPNAAVAVNTSSTDPVQWSISPDTKVNGLTGRIEASKDVAGNAVVRFALDPLSTPGIYQFTVTVKDTAHSLSTSKTIAVTVN